MDKKPLQKERENRSAEKKDLVFHPYTITPETAHTAVLLLESSEPEILCQTLRAITKFSAQDMQNREILFNLEAIKYVLPHIDHLETNVRRFALKALAQLNALPRGPEYVLENSQNLGRLAHMLVKSEDLLVLEFVSLNLAEMTREPRGCEQLIAANILNTLFSRMKNCHDPDVQKNCLQVLSNLLNDPVCAVEVTKNPQFNWPSLLVLMHSEYLAIQHAALKTVDQLICRHKDDVAQKGFRASTGVVDLCDILESYNFRDVHAEVLGVLRNFVETEDNASYLLQSGCILRLLTYLEMALPAMKPHCLAVLTKMSFTENGRDALFQTNTDLAFCQQLHGSSIDLLADAAMGVANMTKLFPSAVRMCETNIIEILCSIMADELQLWFYVRMNALRAICELCRVVPNAACSIAEPKNFVSLRNVSKKFKDNPIEAQRLVLECYMHLLNYHISAKAMVTGDFIQELLNNLQRIDICLKIKTCTVLCGLMRVDDHAKELFTKHKGEEVVSSNLKFEHIGLRTALCRVIIASVTNEGADVYLELGTVHYIVENKQARYVVSSWECALEAIFRHHLSAKFAYTGKLDINDYTSDGLYVQRRLSSPFPTLRSLLEPQYPLSPVFVCIFAPNSGTVVSEADERTPQNSIGKTSTSPRQSRLPNLPDDPNLRGYVAKLRTWFGEHFPLHYFDIEGHNFGTRYREKCQEVSSSLKKQAMLLAEFVQEQMCGLTQERNCSMPSVELHLADLMEELQCSVVGVGWVRCGGVLERGVLYKVLADRVGVPCSLHRACNNKVWCELALPEPDPKESFSEESIYPAGLLRANYVVDLMSTPPAVLLRDSLEAREVCGARCNTRYTPCTRYTRCTRHARCPARDDLDSCHCEDELAVSTTTCYTRSQSPTVAFSTT